MAHPSDQAVQFVFDHFCKALLDNNSIQIVHRINELLDAVNHKPLFKESEGHHKFIAAQLLKIKLLEKDFPFLDLSSEKVHFGS